MACWNWRQIVTSCMEKSHNQANDQLQYSSRWLSFNVSLFFKHLSIPNIPTTITRAVGQSVRQSVRLSVCLSVPLFHLYRLHRPTNCYQTFAGWLGRMLASTLEGLYRGRPGGGGAWGAKLGWGLVLANKEDLMHSSVWIKSTLWLFIHRTECL